MNIPVVEVRGGVVQEVHSDVLVVDWDDLPEMHYADLEELIEEARNLLGNTHPLVVSLEEFVLELILS